MARADLLTLLERAGERAQSIGWYARCSCTIKRTVLQSYCVDKRSIQFVREVSAYKSAEGAIQIINT